MGQEKYSSRVQPLIDRVSGRSVAAIVLGFIAMWVSSSVFLSNSSHSQPTPYFVREHAGPVWQVYGPSPLILDLGFSFREISLFPYQVGNVVVLVSAIPPKDAEFQSFEIDEWVGSNSILSDSPNVAKRGVRVVRVGFPFPAFQYRIETSATTDGVMSTKLVGGFRFHLRYLGLLSSRFFDVPYAPYWPGFIYNLIVWSGLVWIAKRLVLDRVKLAYIKKRAKRRKLEQCLSCGYPIGGISRCPECGVDVEPLESTGD